MPPQPRDLRAKKRTNVAAKTLPPAPCSESRVPESRRSRGTPLLDSPDSQPPLQTPPIPRKAAIHPLASQFRKAPDSGSTAHHKRSQLPTAPHLAPALPVLAGRTASVRRSPFRKSTP